MIRKDKRAQRFRQRQIFNIITNPKAAEYSRDKVDKLCRKIVDAGGRYYLSEPDSAKNVIYQAYIVTWDSFRDYDLFLAQHQHD